jgi:hypothetical protein
LDQGNIAIKPLLFACLLDANWYLNILNSLFLPDCDCAKNDNYVKLLIRSGQIASSSALAKPTQINNFFMNGLS